MEMQLEVRPLQIPLDPVRPLTANKIIERKMADYGRETWLRWLDEAGFSAKSRIDPWGRDVLIGSKVRDSVRPATA